MSDIKLFHIREDGVEELAPTAAATERELQNLVERRMECVLGIRFLAREHSTGRFHRGFIDSLGLDENNCPVIVEYKRKLNENVISQALYYLDWLLDHKGDFTLLARERFGEETASRIEFGGARIICVASNFSRFDERAILRIGQHIELVRYKFFSGGLLLLELLNNSIAVFSRQEHGDAAGLADSRLAMPVEMRNRLLNMSADVESLYQALLEFAEDLGDDVSVRFLKHYVALARLKNFTCVQPLKNGLKLWLSLDPECVALEEGFSRDVSGIGHLATGNLELDVRCQDDFIRSKPLVRMAYERN